MGQKIPLYLVSGFLGSGKTTFLKNVIEYFSNDIKIAIVQNEFAPANFDGEDLKRMTDKNFDVLEINNGSVFCVCLLSGFIDSLSNFIDTYNPELILMEASGLSDTIGIAEVFNSPELNGKTFLAKNICIVDAKNYLKIAPIQQRVRHQVMIADDLIINKTDLTESTKSVKVQIRGINPHGKIYETSFCNINLDDIFNVERNNTKELGPLFFMENSGKPNFKVLVLRISKSIKVSLLEEFLSNITKQTVRLKGNILLDNGNSVIVNCVYENFQIGEVKEKFVQSELIVFGQNIELKALREIYMSYT